MTDDELKAAANAIVAAGHELSSAALKALQRAELSCQCSLPDGATKLFCERHQCTKYRRLVELCAAGSQGQPRASDYWRAWEEGRGPGQAKPIEQESTADKLARPKRYLNAIKRWESAGSPIRSDEDVLRIYAICETCKFFVENRCTHKKCGCAVLPPDEEKASLVGMILPQGFANKLRMATEKCPIGKWDSIEAVRSTDSESHHPTTADPQP